MSIEQAGDRSGASPPSEGPIFVVGVPRSGTTLLAAFLSAHPRIAIAPETHFLSQWLPRFGPRATRGPRRGRPTRPERVRAFWDRVVTTARFSFLDVDAGRVWARASAGGDPNYRDLLAALLQTYAAERGKPRWGEKTPAHDTAVPQLLEWFPCARIVYVLRDPRAVIHSLGRTPWGARHTPDVHALRWSRSVRRMEGWGRDRRIRVVRYERLVTDPAAELAALCGFLGESYDGRMITGRSRESSPIVGRRGWAREHLESALDPVHTGAVERWRDELPAETVKVVEHYAGPEMDRQGYPRTAAGLAPAQRLKLLARRTARRALRRLTPRREGQGGADDPTVGALPPR